MIPKHKTTLDSIPSPLTTHGENATDAVETLLDVDSELSKDANIWRAYVEEANRSDKEMVEGWNASLDVLLIFAALFSAITTAMVIESSKQLEQDPTKVTAQTLLVISQSLIALANKESVAPIQQPSGISNFSPSPSNVVVNALWFSSLSLSVGVSLLAMLSKSWCYSFISRRYGTKHKQAIRRQQQWDSINTWKMKDIMLYLPLFMHLALLFFAIGLCIHLSSVNSQVALPVTAITLTFSGLYLVVTILPLVFKSCPYSTPLSSVYLRSIRPLEQGLLLVLDSVIHCVLSSISLIHIPKLTRSTIGGLKRTDERLATRAKIATASLDWGEYAAFGELTHEHNEISPHWRGNISPLEGVSLDETTCRKLKWLIIYSENNNCVNLALQLITAIPRRILQKHMFKGPYISLLLQRMNNCFWIKDGSPHLKSTSSIDLMLRYCRALSFLVTSHPEGLSHKSFRNGTTIGNIRMVLQFCDSIFVDPTSTSQPALVAIATSTLIPLSHWTQHFHHIDERRLRNAQQQFSLLLEPHLTGTTKLHPGALMALIEASPHWVISYLPELPDELKINSAMMLLKLLKSPDCATLRSQYFLGLALALTAVVTNTYPNWERHSDISSKDRARQVYLHHCSQDVSTTTTLTLFGLLGLLEWSNKGSFSDHDREVVVKSFEHINLRLEFKPIYTLPSKLSIDQYMVEVAAQYLDWDTQSAHSEDVTTWCIQTLLAGRRVRSNSSRLYDLAVKVFCRARSNDLRTACASLLNTRLDIPEASTLASTFTDPKLFDQLFNMSLARNTYDTFVPTAMRHLWSITNGVFEVRRSDAISLFAQTLEREASILQLGAPATPHNMNEIDFANYWWTWLHNMRNDELVAPAVLESSILPTMIQFYEPFSDTQNQGVGFRERLNWWKKLTGLEREYKSTVKRRGNPRPSTNSQGGPECCTRGGCQRLGEHVNHGALAR